MSDLSGRHVDSETRFQTLYTKIRDRICLLQYPPGMALREEVLANEFGVSRTPIRRVLQRLEFDGLVIHTPGAGVVVTTIDLKSLRDVYTLRLKIMGFMAEMMVSWVPNEDITAVEALLLHCQTLREHYDPIELGRLYHQFHHIMLHLISNRPLRRLQDQLFHQTARVWLDILPELDWKQEVDLIYAELSDVITALRQNDMAKMVEVRREHMSLLLQRVNRYLGSADM